jgi:hypothetical protein
MLISDVRGEGADTVYLISDPASGDANWVTRGELQDYDSNWPEKYFGQEATSLASLYFEQ